MPDPPTPVEVACHGLTAAEIADNLHNMAGGYLRQPVTDSTGLKEPTISISNGPDAANSPPPERTAFQFSTQSKSSSG